MNRTALGAGIVIVLAIVLFLVLSNGDNGGPITTTTSVAAPTTTSSEPPATILPSTTRPPDTTTAAPSTTSDLTAREAEIEALVKELDLALWDAIYRQDLNALADVAGSSNVYNGSIDVIEDPLFPFTAAPSADVLNIGLVDVLLDRDDCLVVDIDEDMTQFRDMPEARQSILVLWPIPEAPLGWRIASIWGGGTPESAWISDCDILDRAWRP